MINVIIVRDRKDHVLSFQVSGHAMFDQSGKDIVCAGVSAVTVGAVNSVEALLGIELKHVMEDGYLAVDIPAFSEGAADEQLQLLLESMIVMLKTIEQSYGKYIEISEQYNE